MHGPAPFLGLLRSGFLPFQLSLLLLLRLLQHQLTKMRPSTGVCNSAAVSLWSHYSKKE